MRETHSAFKTKWAHMKLQPAKSNSSSTNRYPPSHQHGTRAPDKKNYLPGTLPQGGFVIVTRCDPQVLSQMLQGRRASSSQPFASGPKHCNVAPSRVSLLGLVEAANPTTRIWVPNESMLRTPKTAASIRMAGELGGSCEPQVLSENWVCLPSQRWFSFRLLLKKQTQK